MTTVTYYVALPFVKTADELLIGGEAVNGTTAFAAVCAAEQMAETAVGAVAFSRSGDPVTCEFQDAVIVRQFGEVPTLDDLLFG